MNIPSAIPFVNLEEEVEAGPALDHHHLEPLPKAPDRRITKRTAHTVDLSTVVDHTDSFTFTTFHQIITMRLDTTLHCICKSTTMVMAGTSIITVEITTLHPQLVELPLQLVEETLLPVVEALSVPSLVFASVAALLLASFALSLENAVQVAVETLRKTLKNVLSRKLLRKFRRLFVNQEQESDQH